MNQRIRELTEQADIHFYQGRVPETGFEYEGAEVTVEDLKKFAELIVRECVKEIEFQYGGGSDRPMDNEWDRAIECVSSMVKYRFGVEG